MPTISEALAEAYATAPAEVDILDTLEVRHAALVDEHQNPSPIRLVRDNRDWSLKLEAGAPLDAGQVVTFRKVLFGMDLPDSTEGPPVANVWIDAVDREVVAALERIVLIRAPIEVTYRAFIAVPEGTPAPEPEQVIDGLKLRRARVTLQRMSGQLTFDQLGNRLFPARVYTRREFPGLAR